MKRVALEDKNMLNPKEASRLFGIAEMKLRTYLKMNPGLPFLEYYGQRILIDKRGLKIHLRDHMEEIKNVKYRSSKR